MNVIFVPDYRNENSYQTNLSYNLSENGTSVYFSRAGTGGGLFALLKSVKEYWKIDVLHIHWTHPFVTENSKILAIIKSMSFSCELMLLRLLGVKIIWTIHNIAGHDSKFKYLESSFNTFLAGISDKLIVHCPSSKREIEKLYKNKSITVIPHGNYIGQYKNTMTSHQARELLNISEGDTVFLYFGQIRPYKGIPELIYTFKKLECQKSKMLIVGKPIDDKIIADILNNCENDDRIKNILKFIPDDDIQIYMNAADIVILPYKNILTSGTVILAMSFGKPIIAPNIRCIADTLDNKGSFLYTVTENNFGMFEAMRNALREDRERLMNMGRHNLRLAEEFGWNKIAIKTYDVYQECINAGQRKNF